ncbi:MAG: hypothetical protein AAF798_16645 [Bacteroidota bacterium]
MKSSYPLFFLLLLAIVSWQACDNDKNNPATTPTVTTNEPKEKVEPARSTPLAPKEGFKIQKGVYIERPTPEALKEENPYNLDNKIFLENRSFTYSYVHYRQDGTPIYCRSVYSSGKGVPRDKAWIYQPVDEVTDETITKVRFSVAEGLGRRGNLLKNKDRTFLVYENLAYTGDVKFRALVGMVENSQNVWLIPFRSQLFNLLHSSPYPYVRAPIEVGNTWEWENEVHNRFTDPRWGEWQEPEAMKYTYEITEKKQIDSKLGLLECFEVKATGGGLIGRSSLVALFNKEYGFIRLSFQNINGTATVFELEEVKNMEPPKKGGTNGK